MFYKFIAYFVTSAALVGLAGCGGDTSSADEPSGFAKTVFKIANLSTHDFASVTIKNASGATAYEGSFRCRAGDATCYINLSENFNETLSIIFKDSSKK